MHESLLIRSSRSTTIVEYRSPYDFVESCEDFLGEYPLIIADRNIPFNQRLLSALSKKKVVWLNGGEDVKSLDGVVSLLNTIEKLDCLSITKALVIGGGTIQDVSSTAFCLLRRGIKWDFIPTTVLAQCDSCIGSKTSINSRSAKNTFGSYWPPSLVYIDESFIYSQDQVDVLSGFGDALHYLFTDTNGLEADIHNLLEKIDCIASLNNADLGITELAQRCHIVKKVYVEEDEFDVGLRKHLNLGHTFGHGIEVLSALRIPHGIAVMHGILIAYLISRSLNYCNQHAVFDRLENSLLKIESYDLIYVKSLILGSLDRFINLLLKDKKSSGSSISFIAFGEGHGLFQKSMPAVDMHDTLKKVLS